MDTPGDKSGFDLLSVTRSRPYQAFLSLLLVLFVVLTLVVVFSNGGEVAGLLAGCFGAGTALFVSLNSRKQLTGKW